MDILHGPSDSFCNDLTALLDSSAITSWDDCCSTFYASDGNTGTVAPRASRWRNAVAEVLELLEGNTGLDAVFGLIGEVETRRDAIELFVLGNVECLPRRHAQTFERELRARYEALPSEGQSESTVPGTNC